MQSATIYSHVYYHTTEAAIRGEIFRTNTCYLCGYFLVQCTSAALPASETSPFHLASIPVLFRKDPQDQHLSTCPTPPTSDESWTPLVHYLIPLYVTLPKPGGFLSIVDFPPVVHIRAVIKAPQFDGSIFVEAGLLWRCVFSVPFLCGRSSSWAIGFRFISLSYSFHTCS